MAGADKIFVPLGGKPLLAHCLETLHESPYIQQIVLVLSSANLERGHRLVNEHEWHKVKSVCVGGDRRQDSVRLGLDQLPDSDWIVVHDGARPFVSASLIPVGLAEARQTGSAVPALPVSDTVKLVDGDRFATKTLPRDQLWAVQTPQVFRRELLTDAHQSISEPATDDAAMVERRGGQVRVFLGSRYNIKVTTPDDLSMAEAILAAGLSSQPCGER